MRKILRKNQIIITALAIMIVVAGYLNFSQKNADKNDQNVGDGEVLDYDAHSDTAGDRLEDGSLVDFLTKDTNKEDLINKGDDNDEYGDISDEDLQVTDTGEVTKQEEEGETKEGDDEAAPGEAVIVSNTTTSDFFINARVEREQIRAKNKDTLMALIDNSNTSEDDKALATEEIIKMTAISEKENATETLLEAKGYSDAVVRINEEKVSVIVNAVSLNEQDVAQVEDIVKGETGVDISKIVISPVVVND